MTAIKQTKKTVASSPSRNVVLRSRCVRRTQGRTDHLHDSEVVNDRQQPVDDDDVESFGSRQKQAVRTIPRVLDRVAALLKPIIDIGGGPVIVLNEQDARTSLRRPAQPHSSSDPMSGMSA
jgi:hypothetical protein